MQDRILNPVGIEEALLVLRLRNQHFDAELILVEKMKPARLFPVDGRTDFARACVHEDDMKPHQRSVTFFRDDIQD